MPSRTFVMIAATTALACQGCFGATTHERRTTGTAMVIGGAAMTAVAIGVGAHYQGDNCREGPGFAPDSCFLPQLGALALGTTGVLLAATGAGNLLSTVDLGEREPVPPATRTADDTACAVWASAYASEADPLRRQTLVASRPGHCAARVPAQGTRRP